MLSLHAMVYYLQCIDIVGFKISRKNATMRASNFRRIRKNLKRINQYTADNIPLHEARAFNSRTGSGLKYGASDILYLPVSEMEQLR